MQINAEQETPGTFTFGCDHEDCNALDVIEAPSWRAACEVNESNGWVQRLPVGVVPMQEYCPDHKHKWQRQAAPRRLRLVPAVTEEDT